MSVDNLKLEIQAVMGHQVDDSVIGAITEMLIGSRARASNIKTQRFGCTIDKLLEMPYDEYLKTKHWREVRAEALRRSGYTCSVCGSCNSLQVHHLTYERLGRERQSDLRVLCSGCHNEVHEK